MMDVISRKMAFREKAARDGETVSAAAIKACGVTPYHLTEGLAGRRPLSAAVKQRFADYIGRSVEEVFGDAADNAA
jgi:hypothetical protein